MAEIPVPWMMAGRGYGTLETTYPPTVRKLPEKFSKALFMTKKRPLKKLAPVELPTAEWLAEKVLQLEQNQTEEERSISASFFMTNEDIRRELARYVLEIYRAAQIELHDAVNGSTTPFSRERIFTPEQIDHGVDVFEAFRMIAKESDLGRAKDKIAIWIDYEHGYDNAPTGGINLRAKRNFYGYAAPDKPHTGESWLEETQTAWTKGPGMRGMPWFLVYELMGGFEEFEGHVRRVPWDRLFKLKKSNKQGLTRLRDKTEQQQSKSKATPRKLRSSRSK